ncbi:MAG: hypothetical protein HQL81_04390 [Magnetococcales bacterium]|nr:hypothetical protein [Magnetococcales bacterium]
MFGQRILLSSETMADVQGDENVHGNVSEVIRLDDRLTLDYEGYNGQNDLILPFIKSEDDNSDSTQWQ